MQAGSAKKGHDEIDLQGKPRFPACRVVAIGGDGWLNMPFAVTSLVLQPVSSPVFLWIYGVAFSPD